MSSSVAAMAPTLSGFTRVRLVGWSRAYSLICTCMFLRPEPPTHRWTPGRGSCSSSCAGRPSSRASTSRCWASRSRRSAPSSVSTARCTGSSARTSSATAASCCSADGPPTCSAGAACSSAALAVFVVFSGLGGLATEGWILVTARFVTGLAAAFMAPAGLSIITTTFAEGPARNKALLVYAGDRRRRVLARPRARRVADDDRLALGVLRAGGDGRDRCSRWRSACSRDEPVRRAGRAASTSPARSP